MSADRAWAKTRVAELLGIRYPIVLGAFGGGTSTVELTAAVSNAGGLGSFGANLVPPDEIGRLVAGIRGSTDAPFAVNLWVPLPGEREVRLTESEFAAHVQRLRPYLRELDLSDPPYPVEPVPDFDEQVTALLEAGPPVFSFIMGIPSEQVLEEARARGVRTIGTATTVEEAAALDRAGVDIIVASGSDAGGHRGAFLRPVNESLVGTFSLVPQVVDAVSAPVLAAGGIADGRGITAAFALGATGVQIGTGFLATEESGASTIHKETLHSPEGRTTMLTRAFSGRLARAIPNRFLREMAAFEEVLPLYPIQAALTQRVRRAATERGLVDFVNLWSGQAAALSRRCPAQEYFDFLVSDTDRRV